MIEKIANAILYMIENKVEHLNDKKVSIMLFLMDYNHLKNCNNKIFNEEYIKDKRSPQPKLLGEIFDIIANSIDLDDEDERLYIIQEFLDYLDIEILKKKTFIELKFIKMEEDFDDNLFDKEELKTLKKIVTKYKNTTARNIANDTFKIDIVRSTEFNKIII